MNQYLVNAGLSPTDIVMHNMTLLQEGPPDTAKFSVCPISIKAVKMHRGAPLLSWTFNYHTVGTETKCESCKPPSDVVVMFQYGQFGLKATA